MIFSPGLTAVMLGLPLPITIITALFVRRRLPVWTVGLIGTLVAALIITAYSLFIALEAGRIQNFGDTKYLGITTVAATAYGIPGAIAGGLVVFAFRLFRKRDGEE